MPAETSLSKKMAFDRSPATDLYGLHGNATWLGNQVLARSAIPIALTTQIGFQRRDFPQQSLYGMVKGGNRVTAGFGGAQCVRRKVQNQSGLKLRLFGMALQVDLQMNSVLRKMGQVRFKLLNLSPQLIQELIMRPHSFANQCPFHFH
jgi:hypothetical protein